MDNDRRSAEPDQRYTCFTCGYVGTDSVPKEGRESCPDCGTVAGDGFGFAENDPRERPEPRPFNREEFEAYARLYHTPNTWTDAIDPEDPQSRLFATAAAAFSGLDRLLVSLKALQLHCHAQSYLQRGAKEESWKHIATGVRISAEKIERFREALCQ